MTTATTERPRTHTARTVVLDGHSSPLKTSRKSPAAGERIALDPDAVARIHKCRGLLERKIEAAKSCTA